MKNGSVEILVPFGSIVQMKSLPAMRFHAIPSKNKEVPPHFSIVPTIRVSPVI